MDNIRRMIIKLNLFITSIVLVFFYIIVIPLGKTVFLIHSMFRYKKRKTFWQTPDKYKLDLNSPY